MIIRRMSPGFTLIELMAVITIISLLCAIAVPNFLNASIRAKVARSEAEQCMLVWALEMYCVDMDDYPLNQESGKMSIGDLNPITCPIPYVSELPDDVFLAPGDFDKWEFIKNERDNNKGYFYINFIQSEGARVPLSKFGRAGGSANYLVYGMGPSYINKFDPSNLNTLVTYNPSNGTSSEGAITFFGP